jgi:DNA-binding NarL/FixJ family response regulator
MMRARPTGVPSNIDVSAATLALVEGVFALIDTSRDVQLYYQKAREVLELCRQALKAAKAIADDRSLRLMEVPRAKSPSYATKALVQPEPHTTLAEETIPRATSPATPAIAVPVDLGLRIAELHLAGKGVRQIARELGINPSTVSRRLGGVWRAVDRG